MNYKNMSGDELIRLAQERGMELTDKQLDALSGGAVWNDDVDEWEYTHSSGCGGVFTTTLSNPPYCPLCGGRMYF